MKASDKEPKSEGTKLYVFKKPNGIERKYQQMIRRVIDSEKGTFGPGNQDMVEQHFSEIFKVKVRFEWYGYGQMNFELPNEEASLFLLRWS